MEQFSTPPSTGLSKRQKTFVIATQFLLWISLIVVVACSGVLIYYITNNITFTNNLITKFNNYSSIANYLKNPHINLEDDCISFDGNTFKFKSPILLSENAKREPSQFARKRLLCRSCQFS